MPTVAEAHGLTAAQLDALALEFASLRAEVAAQLGAEDVVYIRRLIRIQRWCEVGGRASLFLGFLPPFWLAGAAALSLSKILDNMEIGHNVLHGQYDWTNDPALSSTTFEWDSSCPAKGWQHYHNYLHHTFTNITEKDRDLGYGVIRISEDAPGPPPIWAILSTPSDWPSSSTRASCCTTSISGWCAGGRSPWPRPNWPSRTGCEGRASSPSATR